MPLVIIQRQLVRTAMSRLQTIDSLQFTGTFRHTDKGQQVPFLQSHLRPHRREQALAPLDLGEITISQITQPGILNGAPRQRTALRYQHLHMVFAAMFPLLHHALTLRQQKTASQQQERSPPQQYRDTHPGHIKDPEGLHAPFLHQTIHHQVGTGADQGTGTAKDRRITQRQQQL